MESSTLSLVRGNDVDITLTVTLPDGVTPYDLTNCILTFTARQNTYFSPIIIGPKTASLTNPTAGVAVLTFVPADTASLGDGPYYFDIVLTSAASKITTLISGVLTICPA